MNFLTGDQVSKLPVSAQIYGLEQVQQILRQQEQGVSRASPTVSSDRRGAPPASPTVAGRA